MEISEIIFTDYREVKVGTNIAAPERSGRKTNNWDTSIEQSEWLQP